MTGPGGPEIGSGHILVRLISLALIAGVIVMLALWWQNRADLLSMSGAKEDAAPGLAFSPGDEDQGGPSEGPGTGASEQSPAVHAGSAGSPTVGVIGEGPEELLEPPAISLTETPAARGPFHAGTSPQAQDTVPRPAPAIQVPLADVATPSHTAGVVDLASAPTRPVFSAPPVAIAPGASDAAPEPAEPAPLTEPPDSGEVALDFSGPCWIDVRDSSGSVVLTGEMAKGDRRVLAGGAPLLLRHRQRVRHQAHRGRQALRPAPPLARKRGPLQAEPGNARVSRSLGRCPPHGLNRVCPA